MRSGIFPRKVRPREDFSANLRNPIELENFSEMENDIWVEKPARFRNRISPVIFSVRIEF